MGKKDKTNEAVNHPSHYNSGKIEVIDCIESMVSGRDGFEGFLLGTAIKYIGRVGLKDPEKYIEDLDKAIWYLSRAKKNHTNKKRKAEKKAKKMLKELDNIGYLFDYQNKY